MTKQSFFLLIASSCLLAACGRVGDDSRLSSPAALERPAPAAVAPPTEAATAAPARTPMPSPEALTDEAITRRIQLAMREDPAMQGADVSINTDNGVVVLSGVVRSHEQTGIASAHAQKQDGVMRVDNNLKPEYS